MKFISIDFETRFILILFWMEGKPFFCDLSIKSQEDKTEEAYKMLSTYLVIYMVIIHCVLSGWITPIIHVDIGPSMEFEYSGQGNKYVADFEVQCWNCTTAHCEPFDFYITSVLYGYCPTVGPIIGVSRDYDKYPMNPVGSSFFLGLSVPALYRMSTNVTTAMGYWNISDMMLFIDSKANAYMKTPAEFQKILNSIKPYCNPTWYNHADCCNSILTSNQTCPPI